MIQDLVQNAGEHAAGDLLSAYRSALRGVVDHVGRDRVIASSGLDPTVIDELMAGDPVDLTLPEAAAILATSEDYPDADAIATDTRDRLLLGMTTAVLDVDTVAANVEGDMSPTGVQQRIEGRAEMTLEEFARLQAFIEGREP